MVYDNQNKIKIDNSFRCLLSHVNWKCKDLNIYKSLMDYHDKRGGLTVKQMKLLADMYGRYGETKR